MLRKIFSYWQFYLTLVVGAAALVLEFSFGAAADARLTITLFNSLISVYLFVGMIQTLRHGRFGVDILALSAIIATLAIGQYWASLVIVVMLTGGDALEDYAAGRARRELTALLDRAPQVAHIWRGRQLVDVHAHDVKVGDKVLVRTGEIVPVDGVLRSASGEFDESSLTGESLPIERRRGQAVLSGSVNGSTAVEITATATAADSQYERIIALVREAESQPAPFVRLADRYAVPFTLVSYLIASAAWAISGEALRFAEVLVVASPCPLILAAPIALISGMSRASKHGIIVKNGAVLEQLACVNVFAFDKTGTLTYGNVTVDSVEIAPGFTEKTVLRLAISAEQSSSHILAESLVDYAHRHHIKLVEAKNVREITGDGIFATVEGRRIVVGRADFLRRNKITGLSEASGQAADSTAILVAIDGQYAGLILLADKLRRNARVTIEQLKNMGIKQVVMLTGDRREAAAAIGRAAGVDQTFSELLPADKVNVMRDLCGRADSVAMVGDGVNDAPVLAAADVGIAMGARGSTAASESADAVIMLDDLGRVALLLQIARRTLGVALQSVWFGIGLCLVLMIIASFGLIVPLIGAALQELIDVTVIVNALRAHRAK
jgi:heavy metal translocating P-type ATPase